VINVLGYGLNINKSNLIIQNPLLLQNYPDAVLAYDNYENLNNKYKGYIFDIRRASDNAELSINMINNIRDNDTIQSFCSGTQGYICKRYDLTGNGNDCIISVASDQQLLIDNGVFESLIDKRFCYEPANSALSLADITNSVNARMDNLDSTSYIVYKDSTDNIHASYTEDYVFHVNCTAGLMDISIGNGNDIFWYLEDGTTSTADRPAVTLGTGVSYLFCSNFQDSGVQLRDNGTNSLLVGDLSDLPKLKSFLYFSGCGNLTGNIENISLLEDYLNVLNASLITGDIINLSKLSGYLSLFGCTSVYGDVSALNLCSNIILVNCNLVTGDIGTLVNAQYGFNLLNSGVSGILNPHANLANINLAGTAMTANDTDQSLINLDTNTSVVGTITTAGNRTATSDAAVASLIGKGWTVT
jgi:hypothetical protein